MGILFVFSFGTSVLLHRCLPGNSGAASMGPGSVHMADAEGSEVSQDYSDLSSEYSYSSNDEADLGLAEATTTKERPPYRIIDADMLKKVQAEAVSDLETIWSCKKSVAKALLMYYRWDKERLLTDLAEKGPELVYKTAGVAEQANNRAEPGAGSSSSQQEQVTCDVCMCENSRSECSSNGCGHTFCNTCWRGHLAVQIADGQARHISCMAYKCGVVCDDELVLHVMKGERELLSKYKQSHLESYMEDNERVAFCPSVPWCGHAVEVDSDPFVEPECPCGIAFCFKCGKAPHSPCTCDMWLLWDEKINGDSETRNWLAANTKPCPKCSKPVEKNGGCNLVMCKCGQAFCWLCGGATGTRHTWTQIDNHSCGRYKDEADARINDALRSHKRYMHYFERYKQHLDSLTKEKNNRAKLTSRIAAAEHDGTESRDFSWLVKALDQLRTARQVLSNSYAFAYFFFGRQLYAEEFSEDENRVNQNLFEDSQEMLAGEVERLSGLVERAKELTLDPQLRLDAINSSVNINSRIVKFFELVENDLYGKLQSSSAQIAVYRA
ncbi:hypothetical protein OEZ85_013967 [Tetradesmus obliquus]|uniref:IBR domain-containing protein n=1 Tax=Tetradesmus obliquus TaxID=3088 RepID=A0ABY8U6H4_TETOB|nr:hypothetical protein OEZ85_013967 [Tetradesmus obliquus]